MLIARKTMHPTPAALVPLAKRGRRIKIGDTDKKVRAKRYKTKTHENKIKGNLWAVNKTQQSGESALARGDAL